MSTHVPGFLSFFKFYFLQHFVSATLATSSIRVNNISSCLIITQTKSFFKIIHGFVSCMENALNSKGMFSPMKNHTTVCKGQRMKDNQYKRRIRFVIIIHLHLERTHGLTHLLLPYSSE